MLTDVMKTDFISFIIWKKEVSPHKRNRQPIKQSTKQKKQQQKKNKQTENNKKTSYFLPQAFMEDSYYQTKYCSDDIHN